jgi:hypothetical protein
MFIDYPEVEYLPEYEFNENSLSYGSGISDERYTSATFTIPVVIMTPTIREGLEILNLAKNEFLMNDDDPKYFNLESFTPGVNKVLIQEAIKPTFDKGRVKFDLTMKIPELVSYTPFREGDIGVNKRFIPEFTYVCTEDRTTFKFINYRSDEKMVIIMDHTIVKGAIITCLFENTYEIFENGVNITYSCLIIGELSTNHNNHDFREDKNLEPLNLIGGLISDDF